MRISAELRAHDAAGSLAEELPYWGWLEDGRTCLIRSGELIAAGWLAPAVVDGRSPEQIDRVLGRWQRLEAHLVWSFDPHLRTVADGPASGRASCVSCHDQNVKTTRGVDSQSGPAATHSGMTAYPLTRRRLAPPHPGRPWPDGQRRRKWERPPLRMPW